MSYLQVTLTIIVALLVIQYCCRDIFDSRRLEPLFFINMTAHKVNGTHSNATAANVTAASIFTVEPNAYLNDSSSHNSSYNFTINSTEVSKPVAEIPLCPPVPPNLSKYKML